MLALIRSRKVHAICISCRDYLARMGRLPVKRRAKTDKVATRQDSFYEPKYYYTARGR